MIPLNQLLDRQIYFKENEFAEEVTPFFHMIKMPDGTEQIVGPLTLRCILSRYYAELFQATQGTVNAAKAGNKAKTAPMNGKRKQLFSDIEKNEIKNLYASGMSKRSIAKMYRCDEKTIRRILL